MTNHTVDSLLAWMRNPAHEMLWGWDCIAAMARGKTNRILIQDYIARFHSGSYLPAISGDVMMAGNDFKEAIHDFVLDAPNLSFAVSGLDDAKAGLTMSVISGLQLGQRKDGNVWQTVRLSEIDPLQGPELSLELDLNEVPGTVGEGGEVKLDLRHSDNFNLNFALTEEAQRKGGEFFKEKFNALPDEQRVFVLGVIEPGGDAALRPQSFRLRGQRKAGLALAATAEEDAEGAILVFIRMAGSEEGGSPDSNYPYLIPTDAGKDYSATVLFSEHKVRNLLIHEVLNSCAALIGTDDFDYVHDADRQLLSAVAKSGEVRVEFNDLMFFYSVDGEAFIFKAAPDDLRVPALGSVPLTLKWLENGDYSITWVANSQLRILSKITREDGSPSSYPDLDMTLPVLIELSATYALVEQKNNILLKSTDLNVAVRFGADESIASPVEDAVRLAFYMFVSTVVTTTCLELIKLKIKLSLHDEVKFNLSLGAFLVDSIQLNFGHAIQTDTLHLPRDVATFGYIEPALSTFEIVPGKSVIPAGNLQLMKVQPPVEGLVWAVEDLQRSARDPGSISDGGLFRAPLAGTLEGRFLRVRITATDPVSGYQAAALMTVVREPLAINPLIQECARGAEVQLQAGAIGEGSLEWSILNPVDGQSGHLTVHEDQDRTCTYTAISQSIPGQTYVLDEIEVVYDGKSHIRHSVQVLVVLAPPSLSVSLVADATLPDGQVRFQVGSATPEGVQWHLPLGGPGLLDRDTGVYIPDTTALQRFVLVMARYEVAGLILEGHLLRPLPLAEFT